MARRHALIVASILGLVAVLGVVALGRTIALGTASSRAQDALVARRTRQLDRFEASLQKQLSASNRRAAVETTPAPAPTSTPQQVVYVRPKPIVVHKSGSGGREREGAEHERGESEGGGFDD
jgi:hypothetical protein